MRMEIINLSKDVYDAKSASTVQRKKGVEAFSSSIGDQKSHPRFSDQFFFIYQQQNKHSSQGH